MTEKEMIEEMAKVLETKIVNKTWRSKSVARELYRMIIPEGAVVLTREEWEKYQITQRDWNAIYYEGIDKARKETAREFASFVKSKLFDLGNIVNERDIDDMLKEFQ